MHQQQQQHRKTTAQNTTIRWRLFQNILSAMYGITDDNNKKLLLRTLMYFIWGRLGMCPFRITQYYKALAVVGPLIITPLWLETTPQLL
jgi:hypothetical protein